MKRYYLAYGSNLNVRQMKERCPFAKIVGVTEIKNYRLMYKGSKTGSYLTIEKAKGYTVPVAVWETTDYDERRLDIYEGYPAFYYKTEMPIRFVDGKNKNRRARGYVYIMHENRRLGSPSEYYMNVCEEGYKYFGFDKEILDEAYYYSTFGHAI